MRLKIGTRKSALALAQTGLVAAALARERPEAPAELVGITTKGDLVLDRALSRIGEKGLFTRELEYALLEGRIDCAVHSLKDLPSRLPQGLTLGPILERAEVRDVLVSRDGRSLAALGPGDRIGTSSLRRRAQLAALGTTATLLDVRGNVETRLRKLDEGGYEALVLAGAGLHRLGLGGRVTEYLDPARMLPAPCQGLIALELRAGDRTTDELLAPLNHPPSAHAARAERAFLEAVEGGCEVPLGCHFTLEGTACAMDVFVSDAEGRRMLRASAKGPADRAEAMARELGRRLWSEGGQALVQALRSAVYCS